MNQVTIPLSDGTRVAITAPTFTVAYCFFEDVSKKELVITWRTRCGKDKGRTGSELLADLRALHGPMWHPGPSIDSASTLAVAAPAAFQADTVKIVDDVAVSADSSAMAASGRSWYDLSPVRSVIVDTDAVMTHVRRIADMGRRA